jgi:hypothetical protein
VWLGFVRSAQIAPAIKPSTLLTNIRIYEAKDKQRAKKSNYAINASR